MPRAEPVIAALAQSHPSYAHLHVLLDTLLRPCVAVRFGLYAADRGLEFANVYRCHALGFSPDWEELRRAACAFREHPKSAEIIEECIDYHVDRRRAALVASEGETAVDVVEELRQYSQTAHSTLTFFCDAAADVFDIPEDWDPQVTQRVRLLIYRAFALFLLHRLFWRVAPGRELPKVTRRTKISYEYLLLRDDPDLHPEFAMIDPDGTASECLTQEQLYQLKSTGDPFLHDLVNNYDYRTTILSDDAAPPPGALDFDHQTTFAEDVRELEAAGAFALTEDYASAADHQAPLEEVTTVAIAADAVDVLESRDILDPSVICAIEERGGLQLPLRHIGDPMAAFAKLFEVFRDPLGIDSIVIDPFESGYDERGRRRTNIAGVTFVMRTRGEPDLKLETFADLVGRFVECCHAVFPLDTELTAPQIRNATEWGFGWSLAPAEPLFAMTPRAVTIARMLVNRTDVAGLPKLSYEPGEKASETLTDAQLRRLVRAMPLELVGSFISAASTRDFTDAIAYSRHNTDDASLLWHAMGLLATWAVAILHWAPADETAGAASVDSSSPGSSSDSVLRGARRALGSASALMRFLDANVRQAAVDVLSAWLLQIDGQGHNAGLGVPSGPVRVVGLLAVGLPLLMSSSPRASASASLRRAESRAGIESETVLLELQIVLRDALARGVVHRGDTRGAADATLVNEQEWLATLCEALAHAHAAAAVAGTPTARSVTVDDASRVFTEDSAPFGTANDDCSSMAPTESYLPHLRAFSMRSPSVAGGPALPPRGPGGHGDAALARTVTREIVLRALGDQDVDELPALLRLVEEAQRC